MDIRPLNFIGTITITCFEFVDTDKTYLRNFQINILTGIFELYLKMSKESALTTLDQDVAISQAIHLFFRQFKHKSRQLYCI